MHLTDDAGTCRDGHQRPGGPGGVARVYPCAASRTVARRFLTAVPSALEFVALLSQSADTCCSVGKGLATMEEALALMAYTGERPRRRPASGYSRGLWVRPAITIPKSKTTRTPSAVPRPVPRGAVLFPGHVIPPCRRDGAAQDAHMRMCSSVTPPSERDDQPAACATGLQASVRLRRAIRRVGAGDA